MLWLHSPGQEEPTLEARTHMVQVTCLQGGLNKWIQAQTPLSQLWDFDPDSDTDEKVKKWISSCCPKRGQLPWERSSAPRLLASSLPHLLAASVELGSCCRNVVGWILWAV